MEADHGVVRRRHGNGIANNRSAWGSWIPPSGAELDRLVREELQRRDKYLNEAMAEIGRRDPDFGREWEPLDVTMGRLRGW